MLVGLNLGRAASTGEIIILPSEREHVITQSESQPGPSVRLSPTKRHFFTRLADPLVDKNAPRRNRKNSDPEMILAELTQELEDSVRGERLGGARSSPSQLPLRPSPGFLAPSERPSQRGCSSSSPSQRGLSPSQKSGRVSSPSQRGRRASPDSQRASRELPSERGRVRARGPPSERAASAGGARGELSERESNSESSRNRAGCYNSTTSSTSARAGWDYRKGVDSQRSRSAPPGAEPPCPAEPGHDLTLLSLGSPCLAEPGMT